MAGVVAWRWAVSADCAVVSEGTGRAEETGRQDETDETIQEEVGIYVTAINIMNTTDVNCTGWCWLLSTKKREEEVLMVNGLERVVNGLERGAVIRWEDARVALATTPENCWNDTIFCISNC